MSYVKVNNHKLVSLVLIVVGWTLYGLFFASQSYVRQSYFGRSPDWQNALAVWLTCGYSWAVLTPPIVFMARRFPFDRKNWLWAIAVHIPASVVFSVVALGVFAGIRMLFGENFSFDKFQNLVVDELHSCVLVYFGILGVNAGMNYLYKPGSTENKENRVNLNGLSVVSRNGEMIEGLSSVPAFETQKPDPAFAERFTVKENGRIVFVNVREIDRITSEGNYVKLHTNGRSHLLRETMKAMEQKLDPNTFVRVRRSAIVRIEQIKELHPLFNSEFEIVLKSGTKISSSRRYRKNLDTLLKT